MREDLLCGNFDLLNPILFWLQWNGQMMTVGTRGVPQAASYETGSARSTTEKSSGIRTKNAPYTPFSACSCAGVGIVTEMNVIASIPK
jgi:hypothetical protein